MNKYFVLLMGFVCLNAPSIAELKQQEAECRKKDEMLKQKFNKLVDEVEKNPQNYAQIQPQIEQTEKEMNENSDRLSKVFRERKDKEVNSGITGAVGKVNNVCDKCAMM